MKPGLTIGLTAETLVCVTADMCPHFEGVLVHPVYATWIMVRDMEVTGRKLLAPYLEPHEEGVGAHIRVDHRSPATIGARVLIRAEATAVTAHKLTCRMTATCDNRLVGQGEFVQVLLSKTRLEALLATHGKGSG